MEERHRKKVSETQGTSRAGLAVRELFSFTLFQAHVEYRLVLAVLYVGLDLPALAWLGLLCTENPDA